MSSFEDPVENKKISPFEGATGKLPEMWRVYDISDQEIDDLLKNFVKAANGTQLQALQDQLVQAKQTGNSALELQLTLQIIAQKQQDGV